MRLDNEAQREVLLQALSLVKIDWSLSAAPQVEAAIALVKETQAAVQAAEVQDGDTP